MIRNQREAKRIQSIVGRDASPTRDTNELKQMTSFLRNVLEHYLVTVTACDQHKLEMACPLSLSRMVDELVGSSEGAILPCDECNYIIYYCCCQASRRSPSHHRRHLGSKHCYSLTSGRAWRICCTN